MKIEFDGAVSSANANTLSQVIEALLARIQARDTGLDLSALTRILVTDELAAAEQRLGAAPVAGLLEPLFERMGWISSYDIMEP